MPTARQLLFSVAVTQEAITADALEAKAVGSNPLWEKRHVLAGLFPDLPSASGSGMVETPGTDAEGKRPR